MFRGTKCRVPKKKSMQNILFHIARHADTFTTSLTLVHCVITYMQTEKVLIYVLKCSQVANKVSAHAKLILLNTDVSESESFEVNICNQPRLHFSAHEEKLTLRCIIKNAVKLLTETSTTQTTNEESLS